MSEVNNKAVAVVQLENSAFMNMDTLRIAMEMANVISKSDIIPADFKGKPHNCLIALEYANRLGESPFVIMQNVAVINGRPGLSSKYLIHRVDASGLFKEPLEFVFEGPDNAPTGCYAKAERRSNGKAVRGTTVTMAMAAAEGWLGRDRSKWKTMPRKMLLYRAASFFVNEICPQLTFGMLTVEEVVDISHVEIIDTKQGEKIDALNEKIAAKSTDKSGKTNPSKLNNDQVI